MKRHMADRDAGANEKSSRPNWLLPRPPYLRRYDSVQQRFRQCKGKRQWPVAANQAFRPLENLALHGG